MKKTKLKMTFGLTLGVILLMLALGVFIKLIEAVYIVTALRGDLFSPQVIVYVLGLFMLMFISGILLAPTIKAWQVNHELQKKRTKTTT